MSVLVLEVSKVCGGCAVRGQCLGYAVRLGIGFGVFGGMTPGQRRQVVRAGVPRAG